MLVKYLIALQLGLLLECVLLNKKGSKLYNYASSESTKRNVHRYSEVIHMMWLQDYLFICLYKANIHAHKLWD